MLLIERLVFNANFSTISAISWQRNAKIEDFHCTLRSYMLHMDTLKNTYNKNIKQIKKKNTVTSFLRKQAFLGHERVSRMHFACIYIISQI